MAETVAEIGEFGLIGRLEKLIREAGVRPSGLVLGIGDDAAAFRPRDGHEVLVTCDCLLEGRHFPAGRWSPEEVGRRAMVMNISDIGAMGGLPLYALVSLGLSGRVTVDEVEGIYRGFLAELTPLGAAIIGGNLTCAEQALFIAITLIGEVEVGAAVRRSGAAPGDAILVTGFPGQAAAGLRLVQEYPQDARLAGHPLVRAYRKPSHRAREGRRVARWASAMIDISDGLTGDLGHICRQSRVGARLFEQQLPLSRPLAEAAAQWGRKPEELVLGPSDDYELLITCPPERIAEIRRSLAGLAVSEVGVVTAQPGELTLVALSGVQRPLAPAGWDHFAGAPASVS